MVLEQGGSVTVIVVSQETSFVSSVKAAKLNTKCGSFPMGKVTANMPHRACKL